jgi:peptidoglycan/xylan/chitin deacetylase (PgdA/CDA1 family)
VVTLPGPNGMSRARSRRVTDVLERGVDLFLDPRLPHAAPYTAWRRWRYTPLAARPHVDGSLTLCLTVDVEHDYREPGRARSSTRFLPRYLRWMADRGWCSTLYVQGALLPSLSPLLHEANAVHELGLHGLHHEVWGRSRWWQSRFALAGLPASEKRERLLHGLDLFERAGLQRPRAFRAPYLNADRRTLALLAELAFTSDSSSATYLGALPLPRTWRGIWQVPVTGNPRPEWHRGGARYAELSLGAMLGMTNEEILLTADMAVDLQQRHRRSLPPHLVLLAHPWEFEPTAGVPHASEANWERLERIVTAIMARYPARLRTMSGLISSVARPS